jgi:hypothetical protein
MLQAMLMPLMPRLHVPCNTSSAESNKQQTPYLQSFISKNKSTARPHRLLIPVCNIIFHNLFRFVSIRHLFLGGWKFRSPKARWASSPLIRMPMPSIFVRHLPGLSLQNQLFSFRPAHVPELASIVTQEVIKKHLIRLLLRQCSWFVGMPVDFCKNAKFVATAFGLRAALQASAR